MFTEKKKITDLLIPDVNYPSRRSNSLFEEVRVLKTIVCESIFPQGLSKNFLQLILRQYY